MNTQIKKIFSRIDKIQINGNLLVFKDNLNDKDQMRTVEAFSKKWQAVRYESDSFIKALEHQKKWYLNLYGFNTENDLANYLHKCEYVLDAGAGMGGKAAWFAQLSPGTVIIAAELAESVYQASKYYSKIPNLFFLKCNIQNMEFLESNVFDYVSCDQVIHHTSDPYQTFTELVRILKEKKELSCYVYRKKAIPRELLDDFFRKFSNELNYDQLVELSKQLTQLGKALSEIEKEVQIPCIPLLNIDGGKMSVQRFIYWNFIKCFWNKDLGVETSDRANFDWYAPINAYRFSEDEFRNWFKLQNLQETYFHIEKACYSARAKKN